MKNKFVIRDIITGDFFVDDYAEWSSYYYNASIYEKVGEKYYSGAIGEMQLPENAEWVEFIPRHESAISCEEKDK